MLLKHSWAEGRNGKKNNDEFTKTSLDTIEGLSYNQDVYRKIHHSYAKTSESLRIDIARDIHIDKSAYDTLLRNKEKNYVANTAIRHNSVRMQGCASNRWFLKLKWE